MTQQINPYLKFEGKCREAMEFYQRCLGGELTLTTVGESPMALQIPPQLHQQVLHASLSKARLVLLGSDMIGQEALMRGNAFALQLECDSEEEISSLFTKLSSEGGKAVFPLAPSFWGGLYGQLVDKFGNSWMLNYQKNSGS